MTLNETTRSLAGVLNILRSSDSHWVGDGFPVSTLFYYEQDGQALSPFLMLDYAGPYEFPATEEKLGVGPHPHRGFETVTIVYAGEVEHRDSSGAGGRIGPGDVQWMTAASGLVHEEYHGREYAKVGGPFEMVQLWVNLPASHKMVPPRYQPITADMIPMVSLGHGSSLRVIAGEYAGTQGPAQTYSPVNVWDLQLASEDPFTIDVPAGQTRLLVVLQGSLTVAGAGELNGGSVVIFGADGDVIGIDEAVDARALLLCGEPLNEPIFGYGPFVMNSTLEIHEAIRDFQEGKMGVLT